MPHVSHERTRSGTRSNSEIQKKIHTQHTVTQYTRSRGRVRILRFSKQRNARATLRFLGTLYICTYIYPIHQPQNHTHTSLAHDLRQISYVGVWLGSTIEIIHSLGARALSSPHNLIWLLNFLLDTELYIHILSFVLHRIQRTALSNSRCGRCVSRCGPKGPITNTHSPKKRWKKRIETNYQYIKFKPPPPPPSSAPTTNNIVDVVVVGDVMPEIICRPPSSRTSAIARTSA